MKNYMKKVAGSLAKVALIPIAIGTYNPIKSHAQATTPISSLEYFIAVYDINKDGIVELKEYLDKEVPKPTGLEPTNVYDAIAAYNARNFHTALFKIYDANHDGIVSTKDDVDGDGYIGAFDYMKRDR